MCLIVWCKSNKKVIVPQTFLLLSLSRGCSCLRCTNKANRAISRGCTCLRSALPLARARSAPIKQTVQTIGGYGIPAIPTQPQNYLPTEATEPTEVSDARYSTTDCTDGHKLGGYGILPYQRSHKTIFPQKPQNPQKFLTQDSLPQIARMGTD